MIELHKTTDWASSSLWRDNMKIIHKIAAFWYGKKLDRQYPVSRWDFEMFRYHQARSRKPELHEIGKYVAWYPKPPKSTSYRRKGR